LTNPQNLFSHKAGIDGKCLRIYAVRSGPSEFRPVELNVSDGLSHVGIKGLGSDQQAMYIIDNTPRTGESTVSSSSEGTCIVRSPDR
jgi:hypothetical protein